MPCGLYGRVLILSLSSHGSSHLTSVNLSFFSYKLGMTITLPGSLGKVNELTTVYKVTRTLSVQNSGPVNNMQHHGPLQAQS